MTLWVESGFDLNGTVCVNDIKMTLFQHACDLGPPSWVHGNDWSKFFKFNKVNMNPPIHEGALSPLAYAILRYHAQHNSAITGGLHYFQGFVDNGADVDVAIALIEKQRGKPLSRSEIDMLKDLVKQSEHKHF